MSTRPGGLLSAVFSDALAETDPLYDLISRYADRQMLDVIGREYQSSRSGSLELLRKILLASASVPGVFPPVLLPVEAYEEMHVDGGAIAQTFLIPATVTEIADLCSKQHARHRTEYVIRNARLEPVRPQSTGGSSPLPDGRSTP